MEKLDSAIVTHVLKMKEIVIIMMTVKIVFFVDQTTALFLLVLTQKLIVVINQFLEMKIFVHLEFLVEKMKEIVMLIMSVKMVLDVRAVQPILDSIQIYIVAHREELIMEDGIFVQVCLVALMKVIVTMMAIARMDYLVVLTIVLLLLDLSGI